MFMLWPADLPALSHVSHILRALCQAVGAHAVWWHPARLPASLINQVARRIGRAETQFFALVARFRAGRLRAFAHRASPATRRPRSTTPQHILPHRFAWLCPLVPNFAAGFGGQLGHLLKTDPEMQELIAATPHVRRILGPTCRMLGVDPAILTPPKPAPAPAEPPQPPEAPAQAAPPAAPPIQPTPPPSAAPLWVEPTTNNPPKARLLVPW